MALNKRLTSPDLTWHNKKQEYIKPGFIKKHRNLQTLKLIDLIIMIENKKGMGEM